MRKFPSSVIVPVLNREDVSLSVENSINPKYSPSVRNDDTPVYCGVKMTSPLLFDIELIAPRWVEIRL